MALTTFCSNKLPVVENPPWTSQWPRPPLRAMCTDVRRRCAHSPRNKKAILFNRLLHSMDTNGGGRREIAVILSPVTDTIAATKNTIPSRIPRIPSKGIHSRFCPSSLFQSGFWKDRAVSPDLPPSSVISLRPSVRPSFFLNPLLSRTSGVCGRGRRP